MTDARRVEQLRIQAVGAAISRRDWHAVEQAYNTIRDEFDRRPAQPVREAINPAAMTERLIEAAVYYEQASGAYVDGARKELNEARAEIEKHLGTGAV